MDNAANRAPLTYEERAARYSGTCYHCGRPADKPFKMTCRVCLKRLVLDPADAVAREGADRVVRAKCRTREREAA